MSMNKIKALITCGAIAFALSGCGASGGSPMTPSQANVSANVLQLAVGTANYAGTTSLNIVTTYRQPSGAEHAGDSGTLLNSPTLTLPAGLPAPAGAGAAYDSSSTILTGPATGELGADSMTFTSQNPGCLATTTFGQSGGVYGSGIEPFNAMAQADCTPPGPSGTSTPFQVPPYPIPLYDALDAPTGNTDPNLLIPWGGPPAFKYAGSSTSVVGSPDEPTGTSGVPLGIDVFETITPVAGGSYSLAVAVPANTGTTSQSKSFTLPAVTILPLATNPTFVPDGTGGGTLAFTMPGGATEALVELIDFGAPGASPAPAPVYYTIETTSSGTLTLPDDIGPSGAASTSSGDQLVEQVLAFDYPAYESAYPNSLGNPSPTILGASGTDDLSLSAATCTLVGGASCTSSLPLLKHRMMESAGFFTRRHIR
jgi:hypothetical protein